MSVYDFERMYQDLYVYDVAQKGWEHEGHDHEFNAVHVLKHLLRDFMRKDYDDSDQVATELAPDYMQYALRMARWAEFSPVLLEPTADEAAVVQQVVNKLSGAPRHLAVSMATQSLLADTLHGLDHERERAKMLEKLPKTSLHVGRLLVAAAASAEREFGFDLEEMFDRRLKRLRIKHIGKEPTEEQIAEGEEALRRTA